MIDRILRAILIAILLNVRTPAIAQTDQMEAQSLQRLFAPGQRRPPLPFSPAVKAGKLVFVSGTPAVDKDGHIAVGNFHAQMLQVMQNITHTLKAAGADWSRVVKVTVMLARHEDWDEMNRIYAGYFPSGAYPARTTMFLPSLPQPDFLLEIDCEAVLP